MDKLEMLARLHKLRESGVITDEEFADQKSKVISGRQGNDPPTQDSSENGSTGYEPPLTGGKKLIYAYIVIAGTIAVGLTYYLTSLTGTHGVSDSVQTPTQHSAALTNMTKADSEFTSTEKKIISNWWEAEVNCRGSNDRTPSVANCPQRQRADLALNGAGLCYGREDDGSAADYQIHRCGPGSFGYSVPQKRNETCLGYWGTFGATENDGGLSVEIKSSGGYFIQYSDYGNSKGTWRDLPSKPDAIILTGEQYGDSFTLEKCSSEQPEITYNSDGQFFFLTKFSGDYWSEAERRGITISEGE